MAWGLIAHRGQEGCRIGCHRGGIGAPRKRFSFAFGLGRAVIGDNDLCDSSESMLERCLVKIVLQRRRSSVQLLFEFSSFVRQFLEPLLGGILLTSKQQVRTEELL